MIESREIPVSLKTQILGFYKELSRRLGLDNLQFPSDLRAQKAARHV